MARLPLVWLVFCICWLVWLTSWAAPVQGAVSGSVPQAVWQDSDRNHRRSPSQIKHQLRPPQVRAARLPLAEDAQSGRAAKVRGLIAANEVPLPVPPSTGEQLPLLEAGDWRIKVRQAAVVEGDTVLLGHIAVPLGDMDMALWAGLKERQLWPAPPEEGKPLQVNRSRLAQALRQVLGKEMAGRCILPTSLVIQRGGLVFGEEALRSYVVKSLTPQLAAMPGEAELGDFRLPEYIFLAHAGQRIQLEPGKLAPGRVP
ncbi:MAG: flagella basal body P-ring formation protein FlgA, partial [Desulfovibrionaceae bacterium]|nr:flagella basal body P-ring formation protein FlgA [Desulfovibrionaceae bacterium]